MKGAIIRYATAPVAVEVNVIEPEASSEGSRPAHVMSNENLVFRVGALSTIVSLMPRAID